MFFFVFFRWNENDCETLLVDPQGEVYLISRGQPGISSARLAHVPSSGWNSGNTVPITNLVNLNLPLTGNDPTGGDISPDGRELLLITHDKMYYFILPGGNVIESLTRTDPVIVPYIVEPKGEAVAWDYHGNGYFTLGEGHDQTLYYHRRIKETDVVG